MPKDKETEAQRRARLEKQIRAVVARILTKDHKRTPSAEIVREWHREMMAGFMDHPEMEGNFRDEDQVPRVLRGYDVGVGSNRGASHKEVLDLVEQFIKEFKTRIRKTDARWKRFSQTRGEVAFDQVIKLAAWAHGEWVWIHPFADGNGRTARLWVTYVLARYGLPPIKIRPRPGTPYGSGGELSMSDRDHSLMESVVLMYYSRNNSIHIVLNDIYLPNTFLRNNPNLNYNSHQHL